MKTLYRVEINMETVVVAEDRDHAVRIALLSLGEMDGEFDQAQLTASVIEDVQDLPSGWSMGLVPWGNDEGMEVGEWLARNK